MNSGLNVTNESNWCTLYEWCSFSEHVWKWVAKRRCSQLRGMQWNKKNPITKLIAIKSIYSYWGASQVAHKRNPFENENALRAMKTNQKNGIQSSSESLLSLNDKPNRTEYATRIYVYHEDDHCVPCKEAAQCPFHLPITSLPKHECPKWLRNWIPLLWRIHCSNNEIVQIIM